MVRLLNSAMMPREGRYTMVAISKEEFVEKVQQAHNIGELDSYIGYPQNIQLLKEWTGLELPLKREQTTVESGDSILVMKLKYRTQAPKGSEVNVNDFEFFEIFYEGA